MTTPENITDTRLDALRIVRAFVTVDGEPDLDAVRALINTFTHQPLDLLIVLAQIAAAMVRQFAPVHGVSETQYLELLHGWLLDAKNKGDNTNE